MKPTEIYDAAQFARSLSKNLDVAMAFADAGHDADARYKVQIAHAAFASLADQLGYRVERVEPVREVA